MKKKWKTFKDLITTWYNIKDSNFLTYFSANVFIIALISILFANSFFISSRDRSSTISCKMQFLSNIFIFHYTYSV